MNEEQEWESRWTHDERETKMRKYVDTWWKRNKNEKVRGHVMKKEQEWKITWTRDERGTRMRKYVGMWWKRIKNEKVRGHFLIKTSIKILINNN